MIGHVLEALAAVWFLGVVITVIRTRGPSHTLVPLLWPLLAADWFARRFK